MRQKMKQLMGILLSISLMLGLVPGMSLTAYADGTTYNPASTYTGFDNLNKNDIEVTISEVPGKTWYVIANDSSTVTLLSKESFEDKAFNSSWDDDNDYATSEIKTYVDGLTGKGQQLAGISSVISDLTLIDITTAQGLSETKRKGAGVDWWLRSPGNTDDNAACVDGVSGRVYVDGDYFRCTFGVRPALKLNLSSVIFSSESKTFSLKYSVTLSGGANATTSGGATSQTGLTGAMTTVTYTANTGYYFAEFADISSNGITARRTSSTVVTVSGTPTADATITVPDAVAIPTYEVTYKLVNGTWSDGSKADKKETVQSGSKPARVPTGMKAASGFTGGSWDTNPADATIMEATTFTYTFTAKQAATSEDKESKTVQADLTSVPDELKNTFSSIKDLKDALLRALSSQGMFTSEENCVFYDVVLMVRRNGGRLVPATKEDFENGPLTVKLAYPAGTGMNTHNFRVAHMFTAGHTPGKIEIPAVTKKKDGIYVNLYGLSPVAISWTKIDEKAIDSLPQTGDTERPLLYGLIALLACIGIGLMTRKK